MITLDDFKANAKQNGICDEYIEIWDKCISKKDIVDMGFGVKAIDYLCDAISKGWGLSPQVISEKFAPYINGKYTLDNGLYTSQMYCRYGGDITCETTLLTLIECKVRVVIPETHSCYIYACGECTIDISGGGEVIVVTYGEPSDVAILSDKNVRCKHLHKEERDNYGD